MGTGALAVDCTTALVDLDSTVPVVLWLVPHTEGVDSNRTLAISSYYFWTGETPVLHASSVVSVTTPADGVNLVVFDPVNQTGTASFGFAFSAGDCT